MTDGFLGRWSRRKQDVRDGKPLAEPVPSAPTPALAADTADTAPAMIPAGNGAPAAGAPARSTSIDGQAFSQPDRVPLPTLDDVSALTPSSDFKPFMAHGVAQDVRNAAVKKLFADPHFNVMDRLDTYIDDYSQPDPISPAMMRRMASAKVLKLFDGEDEGAPNTPTAGDDADTRPAQDVAQSNTIPQSPALPGNAPGPLAAPTPTEDAHTDLRLQPDDAPQRESAGPGT
jgi:hypothetical protein